MPPKKDPYNPTWFTHSLLESYARCPKAYEFHYLGKAKGKKGKAALAGIALHSRIEEGLRTCDFSDPIFTEAKVKFLAEQVFGVHLRMLCPVEKNGEPFLARPRPRMIESLLPEYNFGDEGVKFGGLKAFGVADVVRHIPSEKTLVIVDWKKSDYKPVEKRRFGYYTLPIL